MSDEIVVVIEPQPDIQVVVSETGYTGPVGPIGPIGPIGPPGTAWETAPFTASGTLFVKVGTNRFPIQGGTYQIRSISAVVTLPPLGDSVIVDVNKNGASIYGALSDQPTIASGSNSATSSLPIDNILVDGDYLTIDIDQAGSLVTGSDLTVVVRMQKID